MTPQELHFTADLLLKVGGAAALVAAFVRWGVPLVRSVVGWFRAMGELADHAPQLVAMPGRQHALESTVQSILAQLLPNGNTSARDALTRVEATVSEMAATQRVRMDADQTSGYFDADADGLWLWASSALLDWMDAHPNTVQGMGWLSRIADFDRERVRAEWRECVADRREFRMRCMLARNGSGAEQVVEIVAQPVVAPVRRNNAEPTRAVTRWAGAVIVVGSTVQEAP